MRLADRLSHLRGAAMKLGQMISMDAGDMLPPELANILASLRDKANFMPPRQLQQMLKPFRRILKELTGFGLVGIVSTIISYLLYLPLIEVFNPTSAYSISY